MEKEALIFLTIVNEVIHWNTNIEIENILEKYSILASELMATSHQFLLNTTRTQYPIKKQG